MTWNKILVFCVFIVQKTSAINYENININNVLKMFVPTVMSINPECQNHSNVYVQELKKLKLWATEMFDASSKFPNGVLFGSDDGLGNFDECVAVKVFLDDNNFTGRHCMAKFRLAPPNVTAISNKNKEFTFNMSVWDKIEAFSNDRRRAKRNKFYLAFCIPSSCQYYDLEFSLKKLMKEKDYFGQVKIDVTVDPLNCQVENEVKLNLADVSFIFVVTVFVIMVIIATFYHFLVNIRKLNKCEGKSHYIVISFSMLNNIRKLTYFDEKGEDRLQCVHGIKVMSMFLIIMGHRLMLTLGSPILNPNFLEKFYENVIGAIFLNGTVVVDTFFTITGFLSCYMLLKDTSKKNETFIARYIHRYMRLTPTYLVIMVFFCTIFVKLGSGPVWLEKIQVEQEYCLENWWTNLLYLGNYINSDKLCMFQSWYLSCDMHLYLIVPPVVWLLKKHSKYGLWMLITLIILSMTVVFAIVYITNENAILMFYPDHFRNRYDHTFRNVYIPTHMRATPYLVGMLAGYLKYHMRAKSFRIPEYVIHIMTAFCILIMNCVLYSAYIFYLPELPYSATTSAIYASMHRLAWSACISYIIIAVSEGYVEWVELLLNCKPYIVLGRLTYVAFLTHGIVQFYTLGVLRNPVHLQIFDICIYQTASDITLSYLGGFILHMIFEAPLTGLWKLVSNKS